MDAALLLGSLADPVVACDASGRVVYANGPAELVLGWPAAELVGAPVDEIVPARLRTVDGVSFYRYLAARTSALEARTVRGPARRKDGVEIEIEFTAATATAPDGGELIVASLRPLHEPSAVRLDESFRQVFENAPLGIFHFDHRGVITACNDRFVELIGSSRRQLLGLNMLTLPDLKIAAAVRSAIGGQRGQYEGDYHSVTADKVTPVRVLFQPIWGAGQVRGGVGIVEDITERKRIEAELHRSERMASVGTLAAGVAHEINNPLTYVLSSIEQAARKLEAARAAGGGADAQALEEIAALVDNAREGADRVRVIVGDLKTFSRGSVTAERAPVDVERVLDSAINFAWNEIRYRARLTKDYGNIPPVVGDGQRLGQVFLNLLVNAAQAIPEGNVAENEIRVRTRALDGDRVAIEVADTGSGIPPELIGRVFEPFVTSKPTSGGTGLGLWICHNIVTAHDGEIVAESPGDDGRGSRFTVRLPARADLLAQVTADAAKKNSPKDKEDEKEKNRPRARRRILIIDDEPQLRRTLARELGARHSVVVAASGAEALDLLRDDSEFDLVLCDVMMPDLGGIDVYERLATEGRPICGRFVFITGGAFTPRARAFLDATARPQLHKPFGAPEVEALFDRS